jgi:nucleoid-associated protein YgaU
MADKGKGLLGGLFGGKKETEPAPEKKDAIEEAKKRTEKLQRETARKADALERKMEQAVKKHVVAAGENLSAIAQKYYDDAGQYMKIYEANKDVIGDNPDLIQPGMELVIPK